MTVVSNAKRRKQRRIAELRIKYRNSLERALEAAEFGYSLYLQRLPTDHPLFTRKKSGLSWSKG